MHAFVMQHLLKALALGVSMCVCAPVCKGTPVMLPWQRTKEVYLLDNLFFCLLSEEESFKVNRSRQLHIQPGAGHCMYLKLAIVTLGNHDKPCRDSTVHEV